MIFIKVFIKILDIYILVHLIFNDVKYLVFIKIKNVQQ